VTLRCVFNAETYIWKNQVGCHMQAVTSYWINSKSVNFNEIDWLVGNVWQYHVKFCGTANGLKR